MWKAAETAPPPPPATPEAKLLTLYQAAAQRYAGIPAYVARLRRREQIGGKNHPEEVMLFKFRKEPWSVYLKFVGKEGRGREVVFVKGRHEGKIHTRTAAGDIPFTAAGTHIALAPDNFLVRANSRYPITEAGIGVLIERFGRLLQGLEQGRSDQGPLKYLGLRQRPEFARPVEAVEQTIPVRGEPALPRGGRRFWFFDPDTRLPALIIALDDKGQEVEYYCYDQLQTVVSLGDDDFNPNWLGKSRS
jgi:hypothetical protein